MKFVSVQNVVDFIGSVGLEPLLIDLAAYLEEDFRRWERFEKAP